MSPVVETKKLAPAGEQPRNDEHTVHVTAYADGDVELEQGGHSIWLSGAQVSKLTELFPTQAGRWIMRRGMAT